MADVWVPRHGLGNGDLPPVCVRTGAPADGLVKVRFHPLPAWILLLLLFGFFPFLVGVALGGELVVGQVPVVRRVVDRHHRLGRWAIGLAATAIGAVALGVATGGPVVVGIGAVAAAGCLGVLGWRAGTWIRVRPDRTGLWVRLQGVHDDFAAVTATDGYGRR